VGGLILLDSDNAVNHAVKFVSQSEEVVRVGTVDVSCILVWLDDKSALSVCLNAMLDISLNRSKIKD
jgi:hypothetical protein